MNRSLEIDLSIVLRHNDYLDSRIPFVQWNNLPYKRDISHGERVVDDEMKELDSFTDMAFPT